MLALRRLAPAGFPGHLQPQIAPQPADAFVVHPPALPLQRRGHPALAVGGPLGRDRLDGGLQGGVLLPLCPVVIATPVTAHHLAKQRQRLRRSQQRDHLPCLRKRQVTSCEACLATSNSRVRRPTIRSSAAIRSWASLPLGGLPKSSGARSTSCAFQWERSWGFSRCSRQISAALLTPVSSSSTTRALKAGVNMRRAATMFPLSWTPVTSFDQVSKFRGFTSRMSLCGVLLSSWSPVWISRN